jgi:DNA-binding response OmpR family regulator
MRLVVTSGAERILPPAMADSGIYLAKPYRPDELAAAIRTSVEERSSAQRPA